MGQAGHPREREKICIPWRDPDHDQVWEVQETTQYGSQENPSTGACSPSTEIAVRSRERTT